MDFSNFDVMRSLGIPNISGFSANVTDSLISFGGALLLNQVFGNYWGVFDQHGFPVLLADSMTSIEYESSYSVATAPVEAGSFVTYNKVANPAKVTVQLVKGSGGVTERSLFLTMITALSGTTDKFIVITPEAVYPNHAIESIDYARHPDNGARMIKANLHLVEVKEVSSEYITDSGASNTSNAQSAGAKPATTGGQKAPQAINSQTLLTQAKNATSGWLS